ncbi:MAG: Holliday junction resolvase RuvX [Acidobacteria bacterium]|nr:Holliday junction resolvase RuvX [Acidobacteriota bacterium]
MRVVAIDYGRRRIGVAVSDPTGTLARPVETIAGSDDPRTAARTVLAAIARLERDDDPVGTIVVGLPRRLDGSANEQTPLAEALAAALEQTGGRRVVLQDERLTSHEAEMRLAERQRDWRERKRRLDAAAAAVILQEFLDGNLSRGF